MAFLRPFIFGFIFVVSNLAGAQSPAPTPSQPSTQAPPVAPAAPTTTPATSPATDSAPPEAAAQPAPAATNPAAAPPSAEAPVPAEPVKVENTEAIIAGGDTKQGRRLKAVYALFDIEIGGEPAGVMKVQLFVDKAPKNTGLFIGLASGLIRFLEFNEKKGKVGKPVKRPYYDGLTFHRVSKGFVAQGGCPFGTGRGSSGHIVPDEFRRDAPHNARGILSAANTGRPDSNNGQIFFDLAPLRALDGRYTVIGKTVSGLEVLDKMEAVPRDRLTDKPLKPIVMKRVWIEREFVK